MKNDKYVVFKKEDWCAFFEECCRLWGFSVPTEPKILPDAIVVRQQDVFASAALDSYANNITAAVEIVKACTSREAWPTAKPIADRLQEIADYFHEAAVEAAHMQKKLPD
jgi:hypothetical protein